MPIKNSISKIIKTYSNTRKAKALAREVQSVPCKFQFYNWWQPQTTESWFYRFAKHRGLMDTLNKQIAFISVFGPREVLKYIHSDICVFYTGENLNLYPNYADYCFGDKKVKLALGFDNIKDSWYLRFPIWLRTEFDPSWNESQICSHIQELRRPKIGRRNKFCALISSHDNNGLRGEIMDGMLCIGAVNCAGEYRHNDDSLLYEFDDKKRIYLRDYIFNICPENSNADGYCTEKIFDAIAAGCIPVYWGSDNMPEPTVLNPEAIIFWDKETKGKNAIKQIRELYSRPDSLEAFLNQPRLVDGAESMIIRYFDNLEQALMNILR